MFGTYIKQRPKCPNKVYVCNTLLCMIWAVELRLSHIDNLNFSKLSLLSFHHTGFDCKIWCYSPITIGVIHYKWIIYSDVGSWWQTISIPYAFWCNNKVIFDIESDIQALLNILSPSCSNWCNVLIISNDHYLMKITVQNTLIMYHIHHDMWMAPTFTITT